MRFKLKPPLVAGDIRTRRRFLFFPLTLPVSCRTSNTVEPHREFRWLRMANVQEKVVMGYTHCEIAVVATGLEWQAHAWAD